MTYSETNFSLAGLIIRKMLDSTALSSTLIAMSLTASASPDESDGPPNLTPNRSSYSIENRDIKVEDKRKKMIKLLSRIGKWTILYFDRIRDHIIEEHVQYSTVHYTIILIHIYMIKEDSTV